MTVNPGHVSCIQISVLVYTDCLLYYTRMSVLSSWMLLCITLRFFFFFLSYFLGWFLSILLIGQWIECWKGGEREMTCGKDHRPDSNPGPPLLGLSLGIYMGARSTDWANQPPHTEVLRFTFQQLVKYSTILLVFFQKILELFSKQWAKSR